MSDSVCVLGRGALELFYKKTQLFDLKKPFIVSDKFLLSNNIIKKTLSAFPNKVLFDQVIPNPTSATVSKAAEDFIKNKCDAVISIGGGSAHDCAKGIFLYLENNQIANLQGINNCKQKRKVPLFCINTTAGTGSGTTNIAIISDEKTHRKMIFSDGILQPDVLISDPLLTYRMPVELSVHVGLDTFTHAIESFLSPLCDEVTAPFALEAMRLTINALKIIKQNPSNKYAREDMINAEHLAGLAFNHASLGAMHAISHALSKQFNTAHGLGCALALPYVLDYEIKDKKIINKLCTISDYIYPENPYIDYVSKAKNLLLFIVQTFKELGVPRSLKQVCPHITDKDIYDIAHFACLDFSSLSNPKLLSYHDLIFILANMCKGKITNCAGAESENRTRG